MRRTTLTRRLRYHALYWITLLNTAVAQTLEKISFMTAALRRTKGRRKSALLPLQLMSMFGLLRISARSQVATADIVGTATDVSGGALSGVKVVATNVDTKMRYSAVISGSGDHTITLLPPGRDTLTAELTEFKSWVANQIELAIGDRLRLDPKLGGWFCNPKRHSYRRYTCSAE